MLSDEHGNTRDVDCSQRLNCHCATPSWLWSLDLRREFMVSTPRKRHASRTPEDRRLVKRPLTSESREEGELDDPVPPTVLPISLPPKPPPPVKVPFPFKKKIEHPSVGEKADVQISVSDKPREESPRKVREEPRRNRNPRLRRTQKQEVQAYGHKFIGCGLQSDYDVTTKLGEGTFGFVVFFSFEPILNVTPYPCSEVHKAIQKSTGKVVALKRILMHNEKEGMPVTALREIKILKALKHDCIVNILDMFVVRSKLRNSFSSRYLSSHQAMRRTHSRCTWYSPTWIMIWQVFWRTSV